MAQRANDDDAASAILSEDELKRMSRQIRELIPRHEVGQDEIIRLSNLSDKVFTTTTSASLTATHRVAAWNTLCAFIDELSRSDIHSVQNLLWDHSIWRSAWDLYITDSQYARPKSAKQLLVTLANALRKNNDLASVQDYIGERASEHLNNDRSPRQAKAFLQLLTLFFSKDILNVGAVNRCLSNRLDAENTCERSTIAALLTCLFRWASYEDFGSVTGRCISVVLEKLDEVLRRRSDAAEGVSMNAEPPVWSAALSDCLQDRNTDIDQLRIHIFPILFKRSMPQYINFLRAHGLERIVSSKARNDGKAQDLGDSRLLIAALLSGKELGLICESDDADVHDDGSMLYIPVKAYGSLLRNQDRSIRITGLSLLVFSHSATRPLLPVALRLLRNSLPSYFADTDANFRSEVFSLVQKLMDRFRAITAVLARVSETSESKAASGKNVSRTLQQHRHFVDWLLRFLTWELRPTASYQRHISALKSLSVVARSGLDRAVPPEFWSKSASAETKWPFDVTILHPGLHQLLLELLVDPFDDVRQTASSILSMYTKSYPGVPAQQGVDYLDQTIKRAEKLMLATGRADQADGVAHMYSLLAQGSDNSPGPDCATEAQGSNVLSRLIHDLERMLSSAQASLAAAAKRYPMHGLLTSIRFIFAHHSIIQLRLDEVDQLTDALHRVWVTVKPVLCNDAPEGYEHEGVNDATGGSSKDTLSYCWRALKESSLLLGTLVTHKALDGEKASSLGHLCFSQLAELRHRGAFSTVAQTWILCCFRASAEQDSKLLLEQWYDRAFDILRNKTTINTRRSAGIPSLLCGLLIADKTGDLLARAFEDLRSIAQQTVDARLANESSLPQVHALNCIKDILKNTRLGEQSEPYVPSSLRLAAESLRSEAWAIRNCGLMLFRGVIDRLLGTSDAYLEDDALAQKRISVQQHPGLLDIVLGLLEVPQSSGDSKNPRFEGVFPALQMLQRIDLPSSQQQQAQNAVMALTASPSWHVRDKAARTYAALLGNVNTPAALNEVIEARIPHNNGLHGALLCLKYATRALANLTSRQGRLVPNGILEALLRTVLSTVRTADTYGSNYSHPMVKAAFIDALVEYLNFGDALDLELHLQLNDILREQDPCIPLDFFGRLTFFFKTPAAAAPGKAFERTCLARAFACHLTMDRKPRLSQREPTMSGVDAVTRLCKDDADACVEFWKALHADYGARIALSVHLETTIFPAAANILSGGCRIRVKCEVQKFLLHLADGDFAPGSIVQACSRSSSPLAEDSNQTYADQWLQLRAVVVDDRLSKDELSKEDLSAFISTCKAAVSDNGFFSREAAALAINRMQHVWPFFAEQKGTSACEAYLIIYDLLNDDDEDIRLIAAKITSRILRAADASARKRHLEPITSGQRLLALVVRQLHESRTFAREAFARAFNIEETVVDQLDTFSRPDTALFATEKQNLYVDPAREVRAWSQVLLRLPPTSIPKSLIRDLTFWVDEGLYTLTSRLTKGKRAGDNGALGWTSNAEAFTLGLQVISAVEVLMGYLCEGGRLPMEGSEVVRRLVLFDQALQDVGEEGNMLWKWEVRRVLGGIVKDRVELAWALAGVVREMARKR